MKRISVRFNIVQNIVRLFAQKIIRSIYAYMKGLSVSYSLMKQNTTAWDHLIKTIEDMKEEVVHKTFDCLSLDDISPNLSGYVKGVRDCAIEIRKRIDEALSGGVNP